MIKIHEKIMRADFAKSLRRLIILAVCVILLGGGISTAMLAPRIREAASGIRQREQDEREYREAGERDGEKYREDSEGDGDSDYREGKERERGEEHDFLENMTITTPTASAVITLGITALCCFLLLFLYWLLVAAWLYQAAVCSGMNGLVWFAVGIAGNVFGAIAFLLVRSFIRVRCPSCGAFLPVEARYCTKCGAAMYEKCTNCGEGCAVGDTFCYTCGKPLHADRDQKMEAFQK